MPRRYVCENGRTRVGSTAEGATGEAACFIPQFVDLTLGHVALQFVVLGFISVILNTLADAAVTFLASRIRQSATARPNLIRQLRDVSAGAMIALGNGLALTRRPAN